jgi:hypothetical protein
MAVAIEGSVDKEVASSSCMRHNVW